MKQFISRKKTFPPELMQKSSLTDVGISTKSNSNKDDKLIKSLPFHPIDHYLLLPLYAWGVADWDLDAIRPFIQEFHPTVGFSVHEACLAARVTILSRQEDVSRAISPEMLQMLHDAGCQVERYNENGILLAM